MARNLSRKRNGLQNRIQEGFAEAIQTRMENREIARPMKTFREWIDDLELDNDQGYRWVRYGDWPAPLHFGLESLIQNSGDEIRRRTQASNPKGVLEGTSTHRRPMYHGTTVRLQPGEFLLPPNETGVDFWAHPDVDPAEFDNHMYVYLSSDPETAREFGANKAARGQKVYVYEVEPSPDLERDPESGITGLKGNYRSSRARITRVHGVHQPRLER